MPPVNLEQAIGRPRDCPPNNRRFDHLAGIMLSYGWTINVARAMVSAPRASRAGEPGKSVGHSDATFLWLEGPKRIPDFLGARRRCGVG